LTSSAKYVLIAILALAVPSAVALAHVEGDRSMGRPAKGCTKVELMKTSGPGGEPCEGERGAGMMGRGPMMGGPGGGMEGCCGGEEIGISMIGCCERHAGDLGLSGDELASLKSIRTAYRRAMIKKRAEMQLARMDLREILDAEPVDFDRAKQKLSEMSSLRLQMQLEGLRALKKMTKVLSSEQRKKLKQLRAECHGKPGPGGDCGMKRGMRGRMGK